MLGKLIDEFSVMLKEIYDSEMSSLIESIDHTVRNNRTVFICGNGGSGANANLMAMILNRSFTGKSRSRSLSLNMDLALLTELAARSGYQSVFVRQLEISARAGDLLIVISGSENSPNIIKAVEYANREGIRTYGLTGMGGGGLKKVSQNSLIIASDNMEQVENAHLAVIHSIEKYYALSASMERSRGGFYNV